MPWRLRRHQLSLSVPELKALITKAGLSFHDCTEKSDLVTRANDAQLRIEKHGLPKRAKSWTLSDFSEDVKTVLPPGVPYNKAWGPFAEVFLNMEKGGGTTSIKLYSTFTMKFFWCGPEFVEVEVTRKTTVLKLREAVEALLGRPVSHIYGEYTVKAYLGFTEREQ